MTRAPSRAAETPLATFIAVSGLLCGLDALDAELGQQHLDRMGRSPLQPGLSRLLALYAAQANAAAKPAAIAAAILNDDSLRPVAAQLVLLWLTGALQDDPSNPNFPMHWGSPESYFSAAGWRIIGAHPPGLSGGYFGHWRYAPENAPRVDP